jgi:pimeloyl-ACP methyl ester carboxylesterase
MGEIGLFYDSNTNLQMASNVKNIYGLPFLSVNLSGTTILYVGNTTTAGGYIYPETAQPLFQTVEYDFWNANSGALPGMANFSPTNTSRLMITPVGNSFTIAGYAKLAVLNGYSGVYGYLGQYFDQAYKMTNGIATANTTGVLSPYGSFFATEPGPVALVTMPDVDTGARGTCTVYCISLQLDRNHDGNMDLNFSGTDSGNFVFWANNNYDRFKLDSDKVNFYDDDVEIGFCPYTPSTPTPDCNYLDGSGHRVIPCERDLQDFTRLWICGVTTNLLAALPAGSTVTMNWGDVGNPNSGNPTIDLFAAADADGGMGYLTNSSTASSQVDSLYCPYIGRIGPGSNLQLNASTFANHWAGNHFIWCGVTNGTGQLTMSFKDGSGNVLGQASVWIQIVDIKQMYERWSVGDNPNRVPTNTAYIVSDGLAAGEMSFRYANPGTAGTPYILYVHGWNMEYWEKDRFAESAFKRLYWQGYHGRFGEFRWPTGFGFKGDWTSLADPRNYDNSEYQAWQSAAGLLNKLNDLNAQYPGHVYMLAHSMGNVVAGEALRLAGNNQVVNTYVASQAALPAHNYDAAVTTPYLLQFTYTYPTEPLHTLLGNRNYGPDTPNIYGNRLTNNAAAVGRRINFYNLNDYALAMPRWGFDQVTKPDHPFNGDYVYGGSPNDPSPWNHFGFATISGTNFFDIVNVLTNRYQVMAYAAESYSTALGATPGITNLVPLDLTTVWPADSSGRSYADHFWHSAQFRGDCWQEWNYWNTLLFSSQFGFNISNP